MNNAKLAIDSMKSPDVFHEEPIDPAPLNERVAGLVRIVEALGEVQQTKGWQTLEELVFSGVVDGLERRMASEAKRAEVNAPEMYRLQGQLAWAKKYANLEELKTAFKVELNNIKQKLNG